MGIFEHDIRKKQYISIQSNIRKDEYLSAKEYSDILKKYCCNATLFITGKTIEEHPIYWNSFRNEKHIELGAHTYFAMPIYYLHLLFKKKTIRLFG